jgi:hypothetical protein
MFRRILAHTSRNAVPAGDRRRSLRESYGRGWLLANLVRALPCRVLRGLDLLASLAAEDADEASDRVRQRLNCLPDPCECFFRSWNLLTTALPGMLL